MGGLELMLEEDAFPGWQCRAVGTTTLCMIRPQASPTPYFFSPETVFGVENSLEIDQTKQIVAVYTRGLSPSMSLTSF